MIALLSVIVMVFYVSGCRLSFYLHAAVLFIPLFLAVLSKFVVACFDSWSCIGSSCKSSRVVAGNALKMVAPELPEAGVHVVILMTVT